MTTPMYRHGDVLLIWRGPAPASNLSPESTEIVVAVGEATGHAHRVIAPAAVALDEREQVIAEAIAWRQARDAIERIRLLSLPEGGAITHEEHVRLELPPGLYEVRIQQTLTQAGRWRRVTD